MLTWILGIALVGVLGYVAYKNAGAAASALGQNVANQLGAGGGLTTVSITAATPQGTMAPTTIGPSDTLIIQGYTPPAGYAWSFSSDTLTLASGTPVSASFTAPAGVTGGTVHATLSQIAQGAGTAMRPLGIYSTAVTIAGAASHALPIIDTTPPGPPVGLGAPVGIPREPVTLLPPTVIAITSTTPKGTAAQPTLMGPRSTLIVHAYYAPAGYTWLFNSDNLTMLPPMPPPPAPPAGPLGGAASVPPPPPPSASFIAPAGVTSAVVQAVLVRAPTQGQLDAGMIPGLSQAPGAGVAAPLAIYKFPVTVGVQQTTGKTVIVPIRMPGVTPAQALAQMRKTILTGDMLGALGHDVLGWYTSAGRYGVSTVGPAITAVGNPTAKLLVEMASLSNNLLQLPGTPAAQARVFANQMAALYQEAINMLPGQTSRMT